MISEEAIARAVIVVARIAEVMERVKEAREKLTKIVPLNLPNIQQHVCSGTDILYIPGNIASDIEPKIDLSARIGEVLCFESGKFFTSTARVSLQPSTVENLLEVLLFIHLNRESIEKLIERAREMQTERRRFLEKVEKWTWRFLALLMEL